MRKSRQRAQQRVVSDAAAATALVPCPTCTTPFRLCRPWQRFCSDRCRWQAWMKRRAEELAS